ncbi:MATE family efflux transporter [Telmatospirillum siberiense]|uniref:Multidrug-efflux transporter n=1 Tax=Telmatospirillum siberiense TaxID=382514 RepID=A0A2N3PSA4_9PROT|nr:MATE family efflux transporter [Telmatospirillum siberiense]PKU23291.1 MATE family efflux transporter [Telmatospirillum siberiense]
MMDSRLAAGGPGRRREFFRILSLAAPLAAAQIAQMVMNLTDSVVMGRIDVDSLAAGSLGGNLSFMMIIMVQGLTMSIQPLVAQARGSGDVSSAGRVIAAGLLISLVASVPLIAVLTQIDHILIAMGEPETIARLTLRYELAFVWAIPPSLLLAVVRNYLMAIERPRPTMIVTVAACLANGVLAWALVFGHLGLPALGLAGSGYATAIVWWASLVVLIAYAGRARLIPPGMAALTGWEIRAGVSAVLRIGWPIAGVMMVEVGLFAGSALLMGHFGPVALAAHQICLGIISLTFMVPLSIGQATTVRVGFHIGAGFPVRARDAGFMALGMGLAFTVFSSAALVLCSHAVFSLYLDANDPQRDAVLAIGVHLILVAAAFQLFDGAQAIASGALRGLKDSRAAMVAGLVGYWVLGMPIGIGLAFGLDFGPIGLWWGFAGGLAATAVLLILRFRHKIDRLIIKHPERMLGVLDYK